MRGQIWRNVSPPYRRVCVHEESLMSVKRPDPVDIEVGHRIRIERLARGLSQTALANQLGVTFQQVQKYEKGVNRVGAGRLTKIAEVLGIEVGTFFSGKEMF